MLGVLSFVVRVAILCGVVLLNAACVFGLVPFFIRSGAHMRLGVAGASLLIFSLAVGLAFKVV